MSIYLNQVHFDVLGRVITYTRHLALPMCRDGHFEPKIDKVIRPDLAGYRNDQQDARSRIPQSDHNPPGETQKNQNRPRHFKRPVEGLFTLDPF
jgi:hypothetical protein